jgi:hypothetical protein
LLIASFFRREAVLPSCIEGIQTDLTDLYAYGDGQLPLFAGLQAILLKLQFSAKKCNSLPENYT